MTDKEKPQTIDDFIAKLSPESQTILNKIRELTKRLLPIAQEAFVYGVPAFKYNGKTLIIYSAFKKHIGIYPEPDTIEHFLPELKQYKLSKGAIQFQLNEPIPYDIIEKIIKYKADKIGS